MSVVGSETATIRVLGRQAYQDLPHTLVLPIALWNGEAQVTGDASAGIASLGISQSFLAANKYAYSLEGVQYRNTAAAGTKIGIFNWANGDRNFIGGSDGDLHRFVTNTIPAGLSTWTNSILILPPSADGGSDSLSQRIFIQRPANTQFMDLQLLVLNVNTEINNMHAWGWMWDRAEVEKGNTMVRP